MILPASNKNPQPIVDRSIKTIAEDYNPSAAYFLDGECVSPNAVHARIQVIRDTNDWQDALPGTLLVVESTNHEWNGALESAAGCITKTGGMLSHVGLNLRSNGGKPGIAGCTKAWEQLCSLDGQMVTFDSMKRVIVTENLPLKPAEDPGRLWANNEEIHNAQLAIDQRLKLHRETPMTQLLPAFGQCFSDPFHPLYIGKPAKPYCFLQTLGLYGPGWEILWRRMPDPKWSCVVENCEPDVRLGMVAFPVKENVYIQDDGVFSLDELRAVVDHCHDDLLAGEATFAGVKSYLETGNGDLAELIRRATEALRQVLSHAHFAWRRDALIRDHVFEPQFLYVAAAYHERILEVSYRLDLSTQQKPWRSRQRQQNIVLHALAGRVCAALNLADVADEVSPQQLLERLQREAPELLTEIENLRERFKYGTEDIRIATDTPKYLERLSKMVRGRQSLPFAALAQFCEEYVPTTPSVRANQVFEAIRGEFPELALLLDNAHVDLGFATTGELMGEIIALHRETRESLAPILDRYETLRRGAVITRLSTILRDDTHHCLAVWGRLYSRLIACVVEACGEGETAIAPNDVFDLLPEEIIALAQQAEASHYLNESAPSRRRFVEAEKAFAAASDSSKPPFSASEYRRVIKRELQLTAWQRSEAQRAGQLELVAAYARQGLFYQTRLAELDRLPPLVAAG